MMGRIYTKIVIVTFSGNEVAVPATQAYAAHCAALMKAHNAILTRMMTVTSRDQGCF